MATVKFGGGRILFHGSGLRPLVPVNGNLNSTASSDIQDDSVLPNLRQKFGEGPFMFQHDNTRSNAPTSRGNPSQKL